jgi:beta-glucanase (GH16 family)
VKDTIGHPGFARSVASVRASAAACGSALLLGCSAPSSAGDPADAATAFPQHDGSRGFPPLDATTGPESVDAGAPADAGRGPVTDSALRDGATGGGSDGAIADGRAASTSGGGPEQCVTRAPVDVATWKIAWSDEFDEDGPPNPANWVFENGFVRNEELQWYQPDNAAVASGLLTITAQRQEVQNPSYSAGSGNWKLNRQYAQYTSSSMTTSGKHSFTYGRFEICAQIDTRVGSWPAFWSLGNGIGWPQSGEVDIMEYYADGVRANVCKPSGATCDWSGSVSQPLSSLGGATWSNSFHLWAMEWDSASIKLYLDDKVVYPFTVSSAVPSGTNPYVGNPFYVLVNLAIGANGGDPTATTFPMTYKVDYVRVYQH